jgi:epoxyqueuosine reductase
LRSRYLSLKGLPGSARRCRIIRVTLIQDALVHARGLGFDRVSIAPLGSPGHFAAFEEWLHAGYHGEMTYMVRRMGLRADPARLSPGARTIIMVDVNYHPGASPLAWGDLSHGRFARYAWAADYHSAVKAALFKLDAFIRERTGRIDLGKVCVDTAPLLEREFAMQAGLGFIGRNTCLITPGLGSWTFLGALLVPESLGLNATTDDGLSRTVLPRPSAAGCGRCTRCLDACPTGALVAPFVLDARRCISYLTIELRGPIPADLRQPMGNWVFGCDVCQEVCPYNRVAPAATWPALAPDCSRAMLPLLDLLALGEEDFRARFRGTPVLRAKRRGLVRNACVAAGNSRAPSALPKLAQLLKDIEPLVRESAAWALCRIGGGEPDEALCRADAVETEPRFDGGIAATHDG